MTLRSWAGRLIAACLILPLIALAVRGMGTIDGDSLSDVLGSVLTGTLFLNTLQVVAWTLLLSSLLGAVGGFVLWGAPRAGRDFFRFLMVLPLVTPPYFTTMCWIHWAGRQGFLVETVGLPADELLYTPFGAAWLLSLHLFPLVAFPAAGWLSRLDRSSWNAGRLHLGPLKRIRLLVWKPLVHELAGSWAMITALAAVNFEIPGLLRVNVWPIEIFSQFSAYYNERKALIHALPLMMLVMLVAWWLLRASDRSPRRALPSRPLRPTGNQKNAASVTGILLLMLTVILPAITFARVTGSLDNLVATYRSTAEQALVSIEASLWAGSLALVIALVMLWSWSGDDRGHARSGMAVLLLCLGVPGTLWGIGASHFFNVPGILGRIYGSIAILVVVQVLVALPFVTLWIRRRQRQWSPNIQHVARIQGVPESRIFRKLTLPLKGGLFAQAWILAVLLAFTELAASLLVVPPGLTTLPVRFFTIVHYGQEFMAAALCLMFMGITLALVAVPALLLRGMMARA